MNRRNFIRTTGALSVASACAPAFTLAAAEQSNRDRPPPAALARVQPAGEVHQAAGRQPAVPRGRFALMAEWGFDFARLPMSYLCWTDPGDWLKLREAELKHMDEAVDLAASTACM